MNPTSHINYIYSLITKRNYIYFILVVFLFQTIQTDAQAISINTTNAPPHSSAILDITSDTRGILIPRMLTSQRTAIAPLTSGLLVFDITTHSFGFTAVPHGRK